ncbi:MAG: HAMP domain-containing sensor histidine kinase [Slackia sp.]|nr:HAMP domain-containing sensor histidine kinase [Slackia sp.]
MDGLRSDASTRDGAHGESGGGRRRGMPLPFFLVKYFVYILLGAFLMAGAVVSSLIVAVDSGMLYPANYASIQSEAMIGSIEARGTVEADDIPSCYRWGAFDQQGRLVEGDFDARSKALADDVAQQGDEGAVAYSSPFSSPVYAVSAALENGGVCVLVYDFNPDFVSKAWRDAFPDPQGALLLVGLALFVAMVALIAVRASRMLKCKLSPLVDAAQRIGRRELDFAIERGNVRETNDILDAVDDMRSSLKRSLEAQWHAEEVQRTALSSLAHDLKTPLTIVRGNADLLLESPLSDEQRCYASYIHDGACDLHICIDKIITAARVCTWEHADAYDESARSLYGRVVAEARALAQSCDGRLIAGPFPQVSFDAWMTVCDDTVQAVMNLVDNAFSYGGAAKRVRISCRFEESGMRDDAAPNRRDVASYEPSEFCFTIIVDDEGPGFSPAMLAHGAQRFYRGDSARPMDGHHGLGLFIAQERIDAIGGRLVLENTDHGARTRIVLPCRMGSKETTAPQAAC